MRPKFRLWVVFGEQVKLGDGRARLLELIDEFGSIKQAVTQVGMSYRNVWGYLRDLEKGAGFKILERMVGGGPRSGTRLTEEGRRFLRRYRRFRRIVDASGKREFTRSFGHG